MSDRSTGAEAGRPATLTVRDQNLSLMLRSLLRSPKARKNLAVDTGIGSGTITRLTNLLIDAGYLEDVAPAPRRPRTTGRPEVPLRIRTDGGKLIIGTQIQASVITADAFSVTGEPVVSEERRHRNSSRAAVLRTAVELTGSVVDRVGRDRILGVGVSTGGQVDFGSGQLISSPILGWQRTDLRGAFEQQLPCPVVVDNSVRSVALERFHWSPWSAPDMLVVVVAGAISSAMIIDGQLYRGASSTAGDISHLPVPMPAGSACDCGADGCASSTLTDAAVALAAKRAGLIAEHADWNVIFSDDSKQMRGLLRARAQQLGRTIGQLAAFADPQLVVVAGAIGNRDDVADCLRQARSVSQHRRGRQPTIRSWRVRPHEWSAGAAALLLDDFLRAPTGYDPTLR